MENLNSKKQPDSSFEPKLISNVDDFWKRLFGPAQTNRPVETRETVRKDACKNVRAGNINLIKTNIYLFLKILISILHLISPI